MRLFAEIVLATVLAVALYQWNDAKVRVADAEARWSECNAFVEALKALGEKQ